MPERKAYQIWIEQCEAAKTIRVRFGCKAAFDYIVGEKLQNFAEASLYHREFAQELPRFVSEVRRLFTADEIEAQLADLERVKNEEHIDVFLEDDDPLRDDPSVAAERVQQFNLIKELLSARTLGTS